MEEIKISHMFEEDMWLDYTCSSKDLKHIATVSNSAKAKRYDVTVCRLEDGRITGVALCLESATKGDCHAALKPYGGTWLA